MDPVRGCVDCVDCDVGKYSDGSSCDECGEGQYDLKKFFLGHVTQMN